MNVLKFKELPYQGYAIKKVTGRHNYDYRNFLLALKAYPTHQQQIKRLRNQPVKLQALVKRLIKKLGDK